MVVALPTAGQGRPVPGRVSDRAPGFSDSGEHWVQGWNGAVRVEMEQGEMRRRGMGSSVACILPPPRKDRMSKTGFFVKGR